MAGVLNRIAKEVINRPLLCHPDYLETMLSFLGERVGVDNFGMQAGEFEARDAQDPGAAGVAFIPVIGSLTHRAGSLDAESGMRSYQAISDELDAAVANSAVHTVFMEFDTPGGAVTGAFELADRIGEISASGSKRVVAFVDGRCCSAGMLLASQANRIYAAKTADVGSIGVVMAHMDRSKQLEMAGVKPTFIFKGDHKVDGNSAEPLPDSVRESFQADIDETYAMFVEAVARGRLSMTADDVRATEARVYMAQDALDVGLIDEISTRAAALNAAMMHGSKENYTMPQETMFTQAQMDAAVADAIGKATKDAHAAAFAEGRKAEAARWNAVMASEHYEGRAKLAHTLLATELSVEQIEASLAASAKETPSGGNESAPADTSAQAAAMEQMLANENPNVGPDQNASAGGQEMSEQEKAHAAAVASAKGFAARKYGRR